MDWEFVTKHTICGYMPVIPALLLYFIILRMIGKRQTAAHVVISFVFCLYFVGICVTTGIFLLSQFNPRIVMIPFVDMIRGPVDTALNVLLFVPLGFFLPLLYKRYDRISRVVLTGFLISLSVEITQLFGAGATDINDLMTNTAGACLGYYIWKLLHRIIPKPLRKTLCAKGVCAYFEVALFWVGTALLMSTVQKAIYKSLF